MKRNLGILIIILTLLTFSFYFQTGSNLAQANVVTPDYIEELKLFSRAIGAILEGYVIDLRPRQLLYSAVKGMLTGLDPYSQFIEEDNYSLLKIDMSGEYSGIGAVLEMVGEVVAIKEIQPDSAAHEAGLLVGDQFLKIDGASVKGKTIPDVAALLRGEEKTPVTVTVWREAVKKEMVITVIRKKIEILAINDVRLIGKAIGYLRIDNFQEHTAEQLQKAIVSLEKEGMKALIVDLRDNQGGLMTAAISCAELFLPGGSGIISVASKIDVQRQKHVAPDNKKITDTQLIVLVNERSASASEIFSASIQDNKRGKIVGVKTFGKASIQSVIPLDETTAFKLTTAQYVTPSGRLIDGAGVEPDFVVVNGAAGSENQEAQVEKALELFKEYM